MRLLNVLAWAAALAVTCSAHAAELKVLVDAPLRPAMAQIAKDFTAETGHTLVLDYGAAPQMTARLAGGEKADALLSLAPDMEQKRQSGLVTTLASDIARIKLGLAMRAGLPRPDISTLASFEAAIMRADSVVHNNVASGRAFVKQLERAGLAERVRSKLVEVPVSRGVMPEILSRTGNDLGVGQMSQVIEFSSKGLQVVGPVPPEVQIEIVYSAGVLSRTGDAKAAGAFVQFLTSAKAVAALKAAGAL